MHHGLSKADYLQEVQVIRWCRLDYRFNGTLQRMKLRTTGLVKVQLLLLLFEQGGPLLTMNDSCSLLAEFVFLTLYTSMFRTITSGFEAAFELIDRLAD